MYVLVPPSLGIRVFSVRCWLGFIFRGPPFRQTMCSQRHDSNIPNKTGGNLNLMVHAFSSRGLGFGKTLHLPPLPTTSPFKIEGACGCQTCPGVFTSPPTDMRSESLTSSHSLFCDTGWQGNWGKLNCRGHGEV